MNIFVTADTHFQHTNIIKFQPETRGRFQSVDEMNEAIISAWNSKVKKGDLVYHLGDVIFGNVKTGLQLINRLNGKIVLIRGNHDKKYLKDKTFSNRFSEVTSYYELDHNSGMFVMSHYPILEWNKAHRGSFMLHGHSHGKVNDQNLGSKRFDVGIDARSDDTLSPYAIEEIFDILKNLKNFSYNTN